MLPYRGTGGAEVTKVRSRVPAKAADLTQRDLIRHIRRTDHPSHDKRNLPGGTTTPVALRSPGTSTQPGPATPTGNPSSAPPRGTGTLSVSTGRLDLVSVKGTAVGKFTLTAQGGPVGAYSITAGSSLVGHLSVSPALGSLAAGASVTITVTSTSLVALNGQLTVNPGGHAITVVLTISL